MKHRTTEINTILVSASEKHPRVDEASLLPFEDGRLFLAYSDYYEIELDEGPSRISGKWSLDEGETWSDSFTIVENLANANNITEPGLLRLPSGRILMTFMRVDRSHVDPRGEKISMIIQYSDDECRTWSEPVQFSRDEDSHEVAHDRLIRLQSGRLLLPGCKVYLSDNEGETWRTTAASLGAEPSVVELSDGSLLMYSRGGSSSMDFRLFSQRSRDGGETWTMDESEYPPNSSTAPCIIRRIPDSDHLLLLWNNNVCRTDLSSAISRDGGYIWENIRNLEPAEGYPIFRSHQYPSLSFLNGNAHITYREEHRLPQAREAAIARSQGRQQGLVKFVHLVYRRLPLEWFYHQEVRRASICDLRKAQRDFFYPAIPDPGRFSR